MKHPYADILIAMANGAEIQIQHYDNCAKWDNVDYKTVLSHIYSEKGTMCIRIKPKTILINGHEVPEPIKVRPSVGDNVFVVDTLAFMGNRFIVWDGCITHGDAFDNGLIHSTKEAAIKHAEALISFTKVSNG